MKKVIKGNVDLRGLCLFKLPDFLSDVEVTGDFMCSDNKLTSLEGCPKSVGRYFWCHNNQLPSLKGCPKSVGGDFHCSNNQLTSLKGCPKSVGGNFYCDNNPKKFTEEEVRRVCMVKGNVYF